MIKRIVTAGYVVLSILLAAIAFRGFMGDLLVASAVGVIVFIVVMLVGYYITENLLKID
jgi:hypothetical protein